MDFCTRIKEIRLSTGMTRKQFCAYFDIPYIAQVKRKHGIIERECYNKAKSESVKMLICPPDKEKAIEDALRFFGMIA